MTTGITNIEVVNAFRNLVADKAQISQSSGWSTRLVYYFLLRYRARLLREKVRQNFPLSHWNYQTIDCIRLVKVPLDECPCAPGDGCSFKKTVLEIPKPISRLKSVTSTNGQITYTFVEWERLRHKINSRFAGQRDAAYYTLKTRQNGTFLYLYNSIHTKYITLTGIFENPLEVQFFPDCSGNTVKCRNPKDQPFILDPDILTTVYDLALGQIGKAKQLGMDILNNELDDVAITGQKPKKDG